MSNNCDFRVSNLRLHMDLDIQKINGKFNPADILTKPVLGSLFKKLVVLMFEGYVSKEQLTEETKRI